LDALLLLYFSYRSARDFVPCGFTDDGLPVGLQLVGRPQDDLGVLQLAHAFEKATGFYKKVPDLALAV